MEAESYHGCTGHLHRLNSGHKKTAWQGGLFNNFSRSIMHIHHDASNAVASGFVYAQNLSRQVVSSGGH